MAPVGDKHSARATPHSIEIQGRCILGRLLVGDAPPSPARVAQCERERSPKSCQHGPRRSTHRTAHMHGRRLAILARRSNRRSNRSTIRICFHAGRLGGATPERWRGRLRDVPFNAVATLDGAPAGLASGVPEEDGSVTLISMWVAPFARGCGVGDRLVRSVVEWAGGHGATFVRLDVVSNNVPAIELYRRNGFVNAGESSHCEIGGVPQREMTYRFESLR